VRIGLGGEPVERIVVIGRIPDSIAHADQVVPCVVGKAYLQGW
jgi:hypothetical protein